MNHGPMDQHPEKGKDPKDNCIYFDITSQERDSAIRYLLGAILNTRRNGRFPSNYYTFDEDVNVYLAHLLFAVSLPEYHEMAEPYLSSENSDILKWVRATEDRTIRYFIFKVNADNILIHTAIFDDMAAGRENKKYFQKSPRQYAELAKAYYEQAAAYHKRIYRRRTGVGEVLEKIGQYFDAYQTLLKHVRRDYFNFVNGFRDQAFSQFLHQMTGYEIAVLKDRAMDRFLELYSRWMRDPRPELEPEILNVVAELKRLDPQFQFDAAAGLYRSGGYWNDEKKCA